MHEIDTIGADWLAGLIENLTDTITHVSPSSFNEASRYLPESVTSIPGYIRYKVNPFMREIVDCFDVDSPVREVNLKKGAQITYSTVLESGLFYFMAHVKTLPLMYITADKELASARIENNILPMLEHSGFAGIIRSSDTGNSRKTGKTAQHLQFEGGGYLVPFGAQNANKMRAYSMCVILKDEIDAWPLTVGDEGCPDVITDARARGYWTRRKIFRGSTPKIKGTSKIDAAFLKGDQRIYLVLCNACSFAQCLRWETVDKDTGIVGGFQWEMENGTLILESVCWCCSMCGHEHYEHDKERLFSEDHGAHWKPTARPVKPFIRSYHLPALYSPIGMLPWDECVAMYVESWDREENRVKDISKYQVFYNTILAESFEILGSRVRFQSVSAHRRSCYRLGSIPNEHAKQHVGSPILFLTCMVDVHKKNLAVKVMGWAKNACSYIIEYWRFEVGTGEDDCDELTSPVWGRLRKVIEEMQWTADDGKKYRVALTFIDAGYANATVTKFCSDYASGVYPILGRDRAAKNATIKEFQEFKTQEGTIGYKILVDHYKDRMAPVLRREWLEESGLQSAYHFNAPVDITDKALKELTVERRSEKIDDRGNTSYYWIRPGNARNELWDLLCYGHAAVDVLAWGICIQHFELDTVEWDRFWDYLEKTALYYEEGKVIA